MAGVVVVVVVVVVESIRSLMICTTSLCPSSAANNRGILTLDQPLPQVIAVLYSYTYHMQLIIEIFI